MTYWNAVLLGLVQGLAEFLPISSSGHLAVLQNFLAIGDMENHMLFDVLMHLGTLAAVVLAFWKDVREAAKELLRMLRLRKMPRGMKPNRRERRLISFLIIATLPLIPAVFLSNLVESLYGNTFFIGFAFIMTGFLLFAADRNERLYDRSEVSLLGSLAAHAAIALDNARLHDQQRRLAEELQRSLHTAPPSPDHAEVVVRYLPAVEAAQVGGDWYDAFLQPGGATMLVIGDVVGHDIAAAAAGGTTGWTRRCGHRCATSIRGSASAALRSASRASSGPAR